MSRREEQHAAALQVPEGSGRFAGTLRHAAGARRAASVFAGAYALALGGQYLVPHTVEGTLSLTIGGVRILFVEVMLVAVILVHFRVAHRLLFSWGTVILGYATMNGIGLANDLAVSTSAAVEAYAPLILLSAVPFSERYRRPLRLVLTTLLVAIAGQVMLYATGVLSSPTVTGLQYGQLTRISTTVGSATATGAVLVMLGAWCVDLWGLNWRGILVGWVAAIAVATTFSRGPMLMVAVTAASAAFAWVTTVRQLGARFTRAVVVLIALGVTIGVAAWAGRLSGLGDAMQLRLTEEVGDAGRSERFAEAVDVWNRHPVFGVGTGEYFVRVRNLGSDFVPVGKTSPHNVYLLVLAENGVVGAALFILGFGWCVVRTSRRWRLHPLVLCIPVIAVVGFTTEVLYVESQASLLWAGLLAWFDRRTEEPGRTVGKGAIVP